MSEYMAAQTDVQVRKGPLSAPATASAHAVSRRMRVAELRRQIADGTYTVYPQRLALKILVKALRDRT
jgi:anti-sigma28 factor (negative regulator of flagellin synthesis)